MKKSTSLLLLTLLMISLAGCGSDSKRYNSVDKENSTASTKNTEISLDDAKQIALNDAGINETDATFTKEKTDFENGQKIYDLEFHSTDAECEYEINISDGTIFSKNIEAFTPNSQIPYGEASVDLEQAKTIALEHAKANKDTVTFKETKLDRDDGIEVYEIDFYDSGWEYEYKIRVSDGSILEYEID